MTTAEAERAAGLKKTVIRCIVQKLQRMDLQELREVYNVAAEVIDRKKRVDRIV